MASIEVVEMMKTLRSERAHTRKELRKLDRAIAALGEVTSRNSMLNTNRKRRKMPAAARRKIAAAQRKRWAKFHQQRG